MTSLSYDEIQWVVVRSHEFEEQARGRIGRAIELWMKSPNGGHCLSLKAMDDHPWREPPPSDTITPSRLRAAILDGLKYAPDGPDKLSDLDLELARVKLTVKWDGRMVQMNIGWLGDPLATVDANVATFGGEPVPAGPVSVRVFCAPTYATSHRWNWPDERGVMRCSCGAKIGVLDGLACVVHSPAIAIERMGFLSQEERNTIASNFLDEEQEHLQGRWRIALGLGWIEYVPAPTEQERCERLGVAWVGPDVQAYDAPLGEGGRIGGHVWALRIQVSSEHRDAVEEAIMCGQGRIVTHSAHRAHGGVVRLGLELREADGVTAR